MLTELFKNVNVGIILNVDLQVCPAAPWMLYSCSCFSCMVHETLLSCQLLNLSEWVPPYQQVRGNDGNVKPSGRLVNSPVTSCVSVGVLRPLQLVCQRFGWICCQRRHRGRPAGPGWRGASHPQQVLHWGQLTEGRHLHPDTQFPANILTFIQGKWYTSAAFSASLNCFSTTGIRIIGVLWKPDNTSGVFVGFSDIYENVPIFLNCRQQLKWSWQIWESKVQPEARLQSTQIKI